LISAAASRTILVMRLLAVLTVLLLFAAPGTAQPPCVPTPPDSLGPFYTPNAPERASTGRGLTVNGVVRTAAGCAPVAGARIEWWSADAKGQYQDSLRATQRADAEGRYRYETVVPGRYPGRPPHLHVRVTAPGHRTLVTQLYPKDGQTTIESDFVLRAD
jgi:protocatechuate 3,4-dioxygenase beta subunit